MPPPIPPVTADDLENSRNIVNELRAALDIKKESAELERRLLNIEKQSLEQLKAAGKITSNEYDIKKEIFKIQGSIISSIKAGKTPSSETLEKLVAAKEQLNLFRKAQAAILTNQKNLKSNIIGMLGTVGLGGAISLTQKLGALWIKHPMLFVAQLLVIAFGKIFDVFKQLDDAAWQFRKTMGATRTVTKEIDAFVRSTATELAKMGVTATDLYNSFVSVAYVIGTTQAVTQGMAADMVIMTAQVGIATDLSAQFLKTLGMVGRSTMDAQKNMLFFAQHMAEAAGIPLKGIMEDIANASKSGYRFMSRSPLELIKSSVEAKRFGTSLEKAASTADQLIDFTKSVNAEMEASVLLGKSINLQRAREFAYRKDLKNLNQEILKLAEETDFENLDPFQQKAVAAALGKSADELGTMVQAAREQQAIETAINNDPKLRERKKLLDAMANATASQAKDYAEIARKQLTTQQNQSRMMSISQSWNKIVMKLAEKFLPAIDTVLGFVADNMDVILGAAIPLAGAFTKFANITTKIIPFLNKIPIIGKIFTWTIPVTAAFGRWISSLTKTGGLLASIWGKIAAIGTSIKGLSIFSKIGAWLAPVGTMLKSAFTALKPIWGWLGGILGQFKMLKLLGGTAGKLIPGLGEAIMIIQGVYYSIKRVFDIFSDFKKGDWLKGIFKALTLGPYIVWKVLVEPIGDLLGTLGSFILKGIFGVSDKIYEAIVSPFRSAWEWLKTTFFGESPSKLGMMIVQGLQAVQSMLINLLVSPFKMAWGLIKEIPFVGKLFKNIGTSVADVVKPIVTTDRTVTNPDATTRTDNIRPNLIPSNEEVLKKLDALIAAIDKQTAAFVSGMIKATVNIDSQKVDAVSGRSLEFKGSLI